MIYSLTKTKWKQSRAMPDLKANRICNIYLVLGMVNFIAKFAPKISEVTAPLRELIKKGIKFYFLEKHEQAFTKLQDLITQPKTLKYVTKSVALEFAWDGPTLV